MTSGVWNPGPDECLQLWVGGTQAECDIIVIEKVVLCVKQSQFYSDIFPDVNCIYIKIALLYV